MLLILKAFEDLELVYLLANSNLCLNVKRVKGEHCIMITPLSKVDEIAEQKIRNVKKEIDKEFPRLKYFNKPYYSICVCIKKHSDIYSDKGEFP